MTTKRAIAQAAEDLHRDRHPDAGANGDARSRKLLVWMDLLALREAIYGELDATAWHRFGDRIITAIADGKRVWPIYAATKRDWHP